MTKDRLYELAFRYRKTRLWQKLWDTELFALKFSDGETGYVCVMGRGGSMNAVNVYPGAGGYASYLKMLNAFENPMFTGIFEETEQLTQQDCMQLEFSCRDEAEEYNAIEIRNYAKRNGIKLAGKNSYPEFFRFRPNKVQWVITDETDMQHLAEGLECAIWLSGELESASAGEYGIYEILPHSKDIIMFERDGDGYRKTLADLPGEQPEVYASPSYIDELAAARIKKFRNRIPFECQIIRWPVPAQDNPDEQPYFPAMLLAVDAGSGMLLSFGLVKDYENNPEEMVAGFMSDLISHQVSASKFSVPDERTFTLLKPLADVFGVRISIKDNLPVLADAKDELESHIESDDEEDLLLEMLENLDGMPDEMIRTLPDDVANHMQGLLEHDDLSPEMRVRIIQLLKRAGKI